MEAELGKGTLGSYEQYIYFNALEKLGNYSFMNRRNFTDDRLLKPTQNVSTVKPTSRSWICGGLGVSTLQFY